MLLGSRGHEYEFPQTEEDVFTCWKELQSVSHWLTTIKFVNLQHQHFKRKRVFIFLKSKSYIATLRVVLQSKGRSDSNTLRG